MSFDHHSHEMAEWHTAIGKALVGFAELELIVYKCLVRLSEKMPAKGDSKRSFASRVNQIVKILEDSKEISEDAAEFVRLLNRARALAATRNDIAHNPVMLNVFINELTEDVALERCITTVRDGRIVDLANAKEFAEEVESLVAEMWLQIGKLADGQ